MVFFFKRKTAYELRISDWSSDVCSSDLADTPRVIIAGFGRVGQIIARVLRAQGIPFVALEHSADQVDASRRFGSVNLFFGDPARPELLRAARADTAEVFVLATDDPEANLRTARLVKRECPHRKRTPRARTRPHVFRTMDLGVESGGAA